MQELWNIKGTCTFIAPMLFTDTPNLFIRTLIFLNNLPRQQECMFCQLAFSQPNDFKNLMKIRII